MIRIPKLFLFILSFFAFGILHAAPDLKKMNDMWDNELKLYVKEGRVDYKSWSKNTQNLDLFLESIQQITPKDHKALTKPEKKSMYINLYNAAMIKAVIKELLLSPSFKSVQDIKPVIWKQKIVPLAGKMTTLDALENDLLRPMFKDPRIHFAIVCASISCPALINQAFTPENLDSLLDHNTVQFLRNNSENYFLGNDTRLSKLFQWFKQDFDHFDGGLTGFLKKYAPESYDPKKEVSWTEYNWQLNIK